MPSGERILTKAERKYLERYAELEAASGVSLAGIRTPYSAVVVIPCYGEHETLLQTLASVPVNGATKPLVVLVVNQRDACPDWASAANRELLARLRSDPARTESTRTLGPGVELLTKLEHDLVLIDRTEPGRRLPGRQGVGLARKIGVDFAFGLWAGGGLESRWIHCTDADVILPGDYFARPTSSALNKERPAPANAPAALVYDFLHSTIDHDEHCGTQKNRRDRVVAVLQYEIFLRYYVLGLRSAGSPYAFQTIGSTLAINPTAYAQVRGFPRRLAAEDFHLLAKLAKVGRVDPLRGEPILLSGRVSTRVPFGTGHAVSQGIARGVPLPVYDPRNFSWLGVWLRTLKSLAANPSVPIATLLENEASGSEIDALRLMRSLDSLGTIELVEKALQQKGDTLRSLNECFDALATLKLIHTLRDEVHPAIPLDQALRDADFTPSARDFDPDSPESLEEQRAQLSKHEAAAC